MLSGRGNATHFKSKHPGQSVPGASSGTPGSVRFLNDALKHIKVRRDVVAARLTELEALEAEDKSLTNEQEAIETAIGKITGKAASAAGAAGD